MGYILTTDREKQYIYIVQASLEPSKCKIGKTNDLERRLKEYNNITGKSKDNIYRYLHCSPNFYRSELYRTCFVSIVLFVVVGFIFIRSDKD
ncbi:MAG: GIY-YIG nuclease family protein [Spirochaetaceae bacterium]|nr:GIY-YIG nuclease family protein [Spirochaetaceae bacterium]